LVFFVLFPDDTDRRAALAAAEALDLKEVHILGSTDEAALQVWADV
jgi:hypothetical protein